MIDSHVHTNFSSDGTASPEAMLNAAILKGVAFVAFTDHLDINKTGKLPERMQNLSVYHRVLTELKEAYRDKISVAVGLECGYCPKGQHIILDAIGDLRFDYIVNSIHNVKDEDVYYQPYFRKRGKQKAYADYLTAVLESLDAVYPYHAIGHLCYPERVAPYEEPAILYDDYRDLYDAIFDTLIARGKILELNSSTAKLSTPCIPRENVLAAYHARGGRLITFSSDAHDTRRIADKYDAVAALAKKSGFDHFAYVENNILKQKEL